MRARAVVVHQAPSASPLIFARGVHYDSNLPSGVICDFPLLYMVDSFRASSMASTPSLGRADESAGDVASIPATPAGLSPYMSADAYSLLPIDAIVLPHRADTPHGVFHAALPDIVDPDTAANVPIRHVCCIGAGYVGECDS